MNTNVRPENLDLFSHLFNRVAVVVVDGVAGYRGSLHTFLNNDSLAAFLKEKRAEEKNKRFQYVEDSFGAALNYVIWNDIDAMVLHSSLDTELILTKKDLEPWVDMIDSFMIMDSLNHGKISMAETIEKMKNKEVYSFGGRLHHSVLECQDIAKKVPLMKLNSRGEKYDSLVVFLTHKSAATYAAKHGIDMSVSKMKIREIASFWNYMYPIVIEPERPFCIEFSLSTLASLKDEE